jgi:hypothetical protein
VAEGVMRSRLSETRFPDSTSIACDWPRLPKVRSGRRTVRTDFHPKQIDMNTKATQKQSVIVNPRRFGDNQIYVTNAVLFDLDQTSMAKWFLELLQMLYDASMLINKHNNAYSWNGSENRPGSPPYRGIDDEWIV